MTLHGSAQTGFPLNCFAAQESSREKKKKNLREKKKKKNL
jgi:hypothetical protein